MQRSSDKRVVPRLNKTSEENTGMIWCTLKIDWETNDICKCSGIYKVIWGCVNL